MATALRQVQRFLGREEGQDLLEYGLLVTLIAIAALAAVSTLGQTIYNMFWQSIGQASF